MNTDEIRQKIQDLLDQLAAEDNQEPDPYAELKMAHAAGKVIQCICADDTWADCTSAHPPLWAAPASCYRIKPWTLPRQLPGFRALRDEEEWHQQNFTQEMLEGGWRPLLATENHKAGDEFFLNGEWMACEYDHTGAPAKSYSEHYRTKRPLPILTTEQIADGWKEWHGGENPAPGKLVSVLGGPDLSCSDTDLSDNMIWGHHIQSKILAYRIIEPKLVPLGPDDVLPGSWIRWKWPNVAGGGLERFCSSVTDIWSHQLNTASYCHTYIAMFEGDYQINRSIPLNGKWDATAWEPCSKEAAQ